MKLLKFFGKRRARKGFTLVELVVVMAIIAILMISVVAFAQPIRAMMSNTNAQNDAIIINNGIGNYIERRLAFANDIKIFVGEKYYAGDKSDPDTPRGAYKAMYDAHTGTADSPRMMVFDFDSVKGSYKVYDMPINSDEMPLDATALVRNNLVYTDDFFGPYSYFITCDTKGKRMNGESESTGIYNPEINVGKAKAYLNFRIDSYHFGDSGKQITQSDISGYNKYVNESKTGTNPFDQYVNFRSGSENVSFALENINVAVKWTQEKDINDNPVFNSDGSKKIIAQPDPTQKAKIYRPTDYTGYCLVIIYNVRTYSYSDIK